MLAADQGAGGGSFAAARDIWFACAARGLPEVVMPIGTETLRMTPTALASAS
jgi:hypothetical protein